MGLVSFELISIIEIRHIFYDREGITDKTDRSVTEKTEKSRTGTGIRTSFKSWTGPDQNQPNFKNLDQKNLGPLARVFRTDT